jgi:hypothetical protein
MYYILSFIYKIAYTLNDKPKFHATFSLWNDKNNLVPFEADSVEELAICIRERVASLKMSHRHVEAVFLSERKYSDRGGTIKYVSPFTESEERLFLRLVTKTD